MVQKVKKEVPYIPRKSYQQLGTIFGYFVSKFTTLVRARTPQLWLVELKWNEMHLRAILS